MRELSREQIDQDMKQFVREIYACGTKDEAVKLRKRLLDYYHSNDVPPELNHVKNEGVGEMLYIHATS